MKTFTFRVDAYSEKTGSAITNTVRAETTDRAEQKALELCCQVWMVEPDQLENKLGPLVMQTYLINNGDLPLLQAQQNLL